MPTLVKNTFALQENTQEKTTLPAGTTYNVVGVAKTESYGGFDYWVLGEAEGKTYKLPFGNVALPVQRGRCCVCGTDVPEPTKPITTSGWYSGHKFQLVNTKAKLVDVACDLHRFDL